MSDAIRALFMAVASYCSRFEGTGETIHVDIGVDFRRGIIRPQFTINRREMVALDERGSGVVASVQARDDRATDSVPQS